MTLSDPRRDLLGRWLDSVIHWRGMIELAATDASFRRYFRLRSYDGSTWIVMDAPPEREDLGPWLQVSHLLSAAGVHVPRIHRVDMQLGFVIMEDLGTVSYARIHEEQPAAWRNYVRYAIEALIRFQQRVPTGTLSRYDAARLHEEMDLFPTWLLGRHLGLDVSEGRSLMAPIASYLVDEALRMPYTFTHRDYHSRNLMACQDPPGVIDFQDAVHGPFVYDLVSLLKDCYIDWTREDQLHWVKHYYDLIGDDKPMSLEALVHCFDLMGVQRHLKAAGIFARLFWRDHKIDYLDSIPRTLNYIRDIASSNEKLRPLEALLVHEVMPKLTEARRHAEEHPTWTP